MEQSPILNALIAAEHLTDGELLVNALRKAGYSVHAEPVADESALRDQLLRMRWDALFLLPGDHCSSPPRLFTLLSELSLDVCCIALGTPCDAKGKPLSLPEGCITGTATDFGNPGEVSQLLRMVRHELKGLAVRRELRSTNTALTELQERYHLLLQSSSDAVAYLHEGLHVYANDAYVAMFGFASEDELRQQGFLDLVDPQDVDRVREYLRQCSNHQDSNCVFLGTTAPHSLSRLSLQCASSRFEDEPCTQIIVRPAAGNIAQQQRLRQQESMDLLTGLLNRNAINARIDQAIAEGIYEHRTRAVLMIKLEEFTDLVLLAGKSVANLLLADVGHLVQNHLPEGAVMGHYGDGEFVVLLATETRLAQEPFLAELASRLNLGLHTLQPAGANLSFGAGVAIVNELTPSAPVVVDRARHNLTVQARQAQTPVRDTPYGTADAMFHRLESAFVQEDFVLVFQPVVNLKEDGIERYEVRIRLQDHDNLIYPPRFLELANQHGLGEKIDRWVCTKSLQLLRERNNPALKLTLNLTHNSIVSPEFLPWLRQQMQNERIMASQVSLQISELDIVSSPEQVRVFCDQLKALGLDLSITHFGCTLGQEPLEDATFIKLDKSLLENIDTDVAQRDRLNTTVSSLHARGLLVIAPMIDSIDLLPYLWQANINLVQGNCLQEPSASMDFRFVQDEEITLDSFQ